MPNNSFVLGNISMFWPGSDIIFLFINLTPGPKIILFTLLGFLIFQGWIDISLYLMFLRVDLLLSTIFGINFFSVSKFLKEFFNLFLKS